MKRRDNARCKGDLARRKRLAMRVSRQLQFARKLWGGLSPVAVNCLKELLEGSSLSVAAGDVLYLDGRWYVTHTGLLRLSARNGCSGIRVQPVREFCDAQASRWDV